MDLTTRPAAISDAAAIADIYNQSVLHSTATFDTEVQSVEEREAWLTSHGERHPVFVAVSEGRVVGWGSLSAWSDRHAYDATAELSVYIDEAARGRGVGKALTARLLDAARSVGLHAVLARICTENEVSLAMMERFGFERVGVLREVGEKFGRLLDVEILEALL